MKRVGRLWVFLTSGLFFSSSCAREIEREEKPKAPDLTALVDAYENPTLALDESTAEGLVGYMTETFGLLSALGLEGRFLGPIYEGLEREPPSAMGAGGEGVPVDSWRPPPFRADASSGEAVQSKQQAIELEGEGFVRVTRVCEGWGAPEVDEEKNGSIVAILGFTDDGLDPVLWGDSSRCRYPSEAGDVLLENGEGAPDAGAVLYIGEGVTAETFGEQPILFSFNLDATLEGALLEIRFSYRVDKTQGTYELLFETPEGSLVLLTQGGNLLGIRASNGSYTCDAEASTCVDALGNSVTLR